MRDALCSSSEELTSTIGVEVESLGSSVLVAINMLVMSTYFDSESIEVLVEFVDKKEEDRFNSNGLDSYTVSGSEDSEDESWIV